MCQGFSNFTAFLSSFNVTKVATRSIRVKEAPYREITPKQSFHFVLLWGWRKKDRNRQLMNFIHFEIRIQNIFFSNSVSNFSLSKNNPDYIFRSWLHMWMTHPIDFEAKLWFMGDKISKNMKPYIYYFQRVQNTEDSFTFKSLALTLSDESAIFFIEEHI